jgi:CheY-like chemotaxis protein
MMVALAEDKTYQREIWEKYCQQLNYTILFSVCNGIEAIEWLTNNSNTLPDILVTDIDMPHMDGALYANIVLHIIKA